MRDETKIQETCQAIRDRLTDLEEGVLPFKEMLKVQAHLLICPECRAFRLELQALPGLIKSQMEMPDPQLKALAQAALKNALSQLPQVDRSAIAYFEPVETSVPLEIQAMLQSGADLALSVMEKVHQAFRQGLVPQAEPHLPQGALEMLPPQNAWKWEELDGAKVATLISNAQTKLMLLVAPRGWQRPEHMHLGSEQMLVLDGLLEDGDSAYATGRWAHFGKGSIHAPGVLNESCWCLVREEGEIRKTK